MDRKKLYIHLGTGKTGTTAIQELLHTNAAVLARRFGIQYSASGRRGINHHLLCTNAGRTDPNLKHRVERHLHSLVEEMETNDAHTFVISSEYFPGVTPDDIDDLYVPLLSQIAEIHPVIYLRRQDTYLESWYAQITKAQTPGWRGGIRRLEERLRAQGTFDYPEHVSRWARPAGVENTHVRPFERRQLRGGDAGVDFLEVLGVTDLTALTPLSLAPNPSLTRDQIVLLQALQAAGLEKELLAKLRRPIPGLADAGSHYLLSPEERQRLVDDHREANADVARTYLGRMDGRLFLDPEPSESLEQWVPQEGPTYEAIVSAFRQMSEVTRKQATAEVDLLRRSVTDLTAQVDRLSTARHHRE